MNTRFTAVGLGLFLLGIVGLFMPGSGNAALVTFDFTGTFVAADPHTLGNILTSPLGPFPASTISGSFTFNGDTADSNGSGTIGQYNGTVQGLSFSVTKPITVDTYQFGLNPSGSSGRPVQNSIVVNANGTAVNQSYVMSASVQNVLPAGPIVDGDNYFAREFFINLLKPSSSVFSTDALPGTPPNLSPFSVYNLVNNPQGQFRLVFQSSHGDHILFGDLTSLSVSAVPVPAAIYLFGSGLIALVGLARRKITATA
jgi:hypothetical protein